MIMKISLVLKKITIHFHSLIRFGTDLYLT